MKYQAGKCGRIFVGRLEDKEDILEAIIDVAKKENVKSAIFYLLGGIKQGKIVVGPEKEEMPPVPVWREMNESTEMLGIGTIFWQENEPKIHFHGAFGKKDNVKVGCLRGESSTFLVLEMVIIEIEGVNAKRELDPVSGLTLLKL